MAKQPNDSVSGAVPFFGNKYIQFGSENPWTGNATDESDASIRTNLTNIECAMISIDDTYGVATGTDGTVGVHVQNLAIERIVSSGAVLVSRSTQAAAQGGQTFSYILIGNVDATD